MVLLKDYVEAKGSERSLESKMSIRGIRKRLSADIKSQALVVEGTFGMDAIGTGSDSKGPTFVLEDLITKHNPKESLGAETLDRNAPLKEHLLGRL